jgi:hypothetical protein
LKRQDTRRLAAIVGVAIAVAAVVVWRAMSMAPPEPGETSLPPAAGVGGAPVAAPSGPAVPDAAATPAAARPRPRLTPEQVAQLGEAVLMAHLRDVAGSDPNAAVELAREGNRRFPDSPDAPERTSILIHALAALDRPSEARGAAEGMVNHYPDSPWVREIEAFTGAHRHRNLRLNDAGQIEYE